MTFELVVVSVSLTVVVVIVDACMGSSNVAIDEAADAHAGRAGRRRELVTEGAVLSGWIREAASISISLAESARS